MSYPPERLVVEFNKRYPSNLKEIALLSYENTKAFIPNNVIVIRDFFRKVYLYTNERLPPLEFKLFAMIPYCKFLNKLYLIKCLYKVKKCIEKVDNIYKHLIQEYILDNLNINNDVKLYKLGYRNIRDIFPLTLNCNEFHMLLNKFLKSDDKTHTLELYNFIIDNYKYHNTICPLYDPPLPRIIIKDNKYIYKLHIEEFNVISSNIIYYDLITSARELCKLFTNTIYYDEFMYDGYKNFRNKIFEDIFKDESILDTNDNIFNTIIELKFRCFERNRFMQNTLFDFISDENIL